MLILGELQRLEDLSSEYKAILILISKRIRRDLWQCGKNDVMLYKMLNECGKQLDMAYKGPDQYMEQDFTDYILSLKPYSLFLGVHLQPYYFEKFVSDVRLQNSRNIIEKQWDNIICAAENSDKAFIDIFDDVFSKCIDQYDDVFFHALSDSDVLCRVVSGWGWDESRFIPWDNKDKMNRWNPPGKTYLYLSFDKNERKYNDELSVSEYICLEEYRAKKGNKYSFCHFKPIKKGRILDLSYNDVELWKIEMALDRYQEIVKDLFVNSTLSDQAELKKMGTTKRSVKRYIKKNVDETIIDRSIIEKAIAKTYLKMVCNTIYKKVDEDDNAGKEKAYKSFHILAGYLESKGITGIIYPCTRTKIIIGKNLVLFNRYDAVPIKDSIREIIYKQMSSWLYKLLVNNVVKNFVYYKPMK